jgi:hypothetical protein
MIILAPIMSMKQCIDFHLVIMFYSYYDRNVIFIILIIRIDTNHIH